MISLRSSGPKTEKTKDIFEQKIAKVAQSHSLYKLVRSDLSRYSSAEVALGAGCFFFVIFAIFCANDSLRSPGTKTEKNKKHF
jgi:hypothetical protein